MYVHDLAEWPKFTWNDHGLASLLKDVQIRLNSLTAELSKLGFEDQSEANLRSLTNEVVKTSEIEGNALDPALVRSSIATKLGLAQGGVRRIERSVEGIVEVVLDATQRCEEPLSEARLFGWHAALFPTGYSELAKIIVGNWRDDANGPMAVVSGAYGHHKAHFEAPSHIRLQSEMDKFIDWFNQNQSIDPVIKAGVAHFWFVTIHPFSDGNGRIARAIADLMLARADQITQRYYSMSAQINIDKVDYYNVLETSQKANLDITNWLEWFLECLIRSIKNAENTLVDLLQKTRVWAFLSPCAVNERQRKILNMLLDRTFVGHLNASKYSKINHCSSDTANRDLKELESYGVLKREGKGKATRYELTPLPPDAPYVIAEI
jgi:Fic family protein